MPRDIRNTKLQDELFQTLLSDPKTMENPSAQLFSELFAAHKNSPPKYRVDDIIYIGSAQSPFVKENTSTTIGIFIVNKFILEPLQVFGYVNHPFDEKAVGRMESNVADALMQKDITVQQVA